MEKYDLSVTVEYENDDDYRTCLLAVFRLKEFGEALIDTIDGVRKVTTDPTLLEAAARLGVGFTDDLAFFMLFSYDEFKQTHARLNVVHGVPN